MSTLTEEEKRHIEEKIKYENEVRARYMQSPAPERQQNNGKKTYSDKLEPQEIKNVIIPQFAKAAEITSYVEKNAAIVQALMDEDKKLREERENVPKATFVSVIFILLFLAWVICAYNADPSFEEYALMSTGQKFLYFPAFLMRKFLNVPFYVTFNAKHPFLGFWAVVFLAFVVPCILGSVISELVKALYTQTIKNKIYSDKITKNEKEAAKVNDDLMAYYDEHISELGFLPEKYQNYDAVSHVLELFQTFRVDSMKEAFNKYEEDLHNRHVEQGFQTLHTTMQQTNDMLRTVSIWFEKQKR